MDAKRTKAADVWRERVAAQQASGRPVRAWCREHGCPEHGFYWWRAKLALSPADLQRFAEGERRGRPRRRRPHLRGLAVVGGDGRGRRQRRAADAE